MTRRYNTFLAVILTAICIAFASRSIVHYDAMPRPQGLTVAVEKFIAATESGVQQTELDSTVIDQMVTIDPSKTALVLIDVWASHPNGGWMDRAKVVTSDRIVPLVEAVRGTDIRVVHAPHNTPMSALVQPVKGEINADEKGIATTAAFKAWLHEEGITTLIYAGYSSNWCVMHRPIGIIRMEPDFDVIFVRDASLAFETPESLDGEWGHKMAVNYVRINSHTTTVAKVIAAIRD